jgi:hypothetical protein
MLSSIAAVFALYSQKSVRFTAKNLCALQRNKSFGVHRYGKTFVSSGTRTQAFRAAVIQPPVN